MAEAWEEAGDRLAGAGEALSRRVQERPYPVLALAAMAGYVAGGGLFSAFTRPLARAALGALLVPGVRERLRDMTGELRRPAGGTA